MEENLIEINGGIIINVDTSAKNIIYVKKLYLLHVVAKMVSI